MTDYEHSNKEPIVNFKFARLARSPFVLTEHMTSIKVLYYDSLGIAITDGMFGKGRGQVVLAGFQCKGKERSLWDCPNNTRNANPAKCTIHAGVACGCTLRVKLYSSIHCNVNMNV